MDRQIAGTNNIASRLRCVWIVVYGLFCGLLSSLTTPPVAIREEEQLLFGELTQPRKMQIGRSGIALLPRVERCSESTGIGNVLSQRQTSIHMENLARGTFHGEVGVLVDEALGPLFEGLDSLRIPPVRIIANFIVVATGGIECYISINDT